MNFSDFSPPFKFKDAKNLPLWQTEWAKLITATGEERNWFSPDSTNSIHQAQLHGVGKSVDINLSAYGERKSTRSARKDFELGKTLSEN
jgi:hypothetical protein